MVKFSKEKIKDESKVVWIIIEAKMDRLGMSMRQLEIKVEGSVTGSLKRKIEYNICKLNEILKALNLEVSVVEKSK